MTGSCWYAGAQVIFFQVMLWPVYKSNSVCVPYAQGGQYKTRARTQKKTDIRREREREWVQNKTFVTPAVKTDKKNALKSMGLVDSPVPTPLLMHLQCRQMTLKFLSTY